MTFVLSSAAGDAVPGGIRFAGELDDAWMGRFPMPGGRLSVFGNAGDLAGCAEKVGANAAYAGTGLPLESAPDSAWGVRVQKDPTAFLGLCRFLEGTDLTCDLYLGERNNPFFTYYPKVFEERRPEAFMQGIDGALIRTAYNPIRDVASPVPAVCDPVLLGLSREYILSMVDALKGYEGIRNWVIGAEEAYPDYFALSAGDFQAAVRDQFRRFCVLRGWREPPSDLEPVLSHENGPLKAAWTIFREQAMADRAAYYTRAFLEADGGRPILFPTHGSPFARTQRRGLGLDPGGLAGACDGYEMGHILVDDDDERLNLLFTTTLTSLGVPVTVPRLGNKTLDPGARGGGRSFTPVMLRRLVYECLGMGITHIGPIDWVTNLGDGEWRIQGTPAEAACREVFCEIRTAWPWLQGMRRLQPRVGIYVSDAAWRRGWNPRWTGLFQEALDRHWQVAVVSDAMLGADLADRIPCLLSVENDGVGSRARRGLEAYLEAGGEMFAWGGFGLEDELGQVDATDLAVARVSFPAAQEERVLVNEFQTGNGAFGWAHRYRPVPLSGFQAALAGTAAEEALAPTGLTSGADVSQVEVLTLTDGQSLLAVLVNRAAAPVALEASPAPGLLAPDDGAGWAACDLLTGKVLCAGAPRAGVTLGGHGTALLWFAPAREEYVVQAEVERAHRAVARWSALGADTSSVEALLPGDSVAGLSPLLRWKADSLARTVVASLCLVPSAAWGENGRLAVSATVYDSGGGVVEGARVTVRVAPGSLERHALRATGNGGYEADLAGDALGHYFEPGSGVYAPVAGPVRVAFSAAEGDRRGGAIRVAR